MYQTVILDTVNLEKQNKETEMEYLVVMITGRYTYLSKYISDYLKRQVGVVTDLVVDMSIMDEFGIEATEMLEGQSNILGFDDFMSEVTTANLLGKWLCIVELESLTKVQHKQLQEYMKAPSKNGLLIVLGQRYNEYKWYLGNRVFKYSKETHLADISYPKRDFLYKVVQDKFQENKIALTEDALKVFVVRMGREYNRYGDEIHRISEELGMNSASKREMELTQSDMKELMKDVNYYTMDMFLYQLLKPLDKDKLVRRGQMYKMLYNLIDSIGTEELVRYTKRMVSQVKYMRILINDGVLPALSGVSAKELQKKLEVLDVNIFENASEYQLQRLFRISLQSTLRDWVLLESMLDSLVVSSDYVTLTRVEKEREKEKEAELKLYGRENPETEGKEKQSQQRKVNKERSSKEQCEALLITLLHRYTIKEQVLESHLVGGDVLNRGLDYLDSLQYTEQ